MPLMLKQYVKTLVSSLIDSPESFGIERFLLSADNRFGEHNLLKSILNHHIQGHEISNNCINYTSNPQSFMFC